jgi:hypothetical protein
MVGPILSRRRTCARAIKPEDSADGKPLHAHLDIYIAAANCDTIAKFAASLGQSERENPARWLTWLRRLRNANVERVEDGIQMARRMTNLRQARDAAGRVSYLNGIFAFPVFGT